MSFEAVRNLDSRTRDAEITETAGSLLDRYKIVSDRMRQMAIQPESLIIPGEENDIYTQESVAQDQKYVAQMHKIFADQATEHPKYGLSTAEIKKLAEIAEYDLMRGINIGKWIPQGRALKTSEYDDIRNGVDFVLEIGRRDSIIGHLGMAVDVSFSLNLQGKFQRIKEEIDTYNGRQQRLGVVKYFQSDRAGMRGELNNIARTVAAFDLPVLEDFAVKNDKLENHIGQAILISEMKRQLSTFHEYAIDANPACAECLVRPLQMISAIDNMTGATTRLEESGYTKNKQADEAIRAGLDLFS